MKMTVTLCDFCDSQIPEDFDGGRMDHRRLRIQEGIIKEVGFFQRPKLIWKDITLCDICAEQIIDKSRKLMEEK